MFFVAGIFDKYLQVAQSVVKYNHRKGGAVIPSILKGVTAMTTSEVLQLLELLAVVIFGILTYIKK